MSEKQTSAPVSKAVYNRRQAARRKKQKRQRIRKTVSVLAAVLALAGLITGVALLTKGNSSGRLLVGTWVYDENTVYRFGEDGRGCMEIGDGDFAYTYTVKGNEVSLDFEQVALHDCTYTFKVKGNTLTLVGGEGTVGGEYELRRSDTPQ